MANDGLAKKAAENLRAATLLVGAREYNAAASRAYFALYQAGMFALEGKGMTPGTFGDYTEWNHRLIKNNRRAFGLNWEERELWEDLYELRVKADYRDADVQREEIEPALGEVADVLQRLGVEI